MKNLSLLVVSALLCAPAFAQRNRMEEETHGADMDASEDNQLVLSIFGLAHSSEEQVRENETETDFDFGGGAFIEGEINEHFGIETGAYLVNRQYEDENFIGSVTQEVNRLHVPVLARFWANDWLSVGLGPYAAFAVGDESTAVSIGDTELAEINTEASEEIEVGLDASLALNFAIDDKTGIFIEGRYSRPFDNEANDQFANDVSGLAGVKINL